MIWPHASSSFMDACKKSGEHDKSMMAEGILLTFFVFLSQILAPGYLYHNCLFLHLFTSFERQKYGHLLTYFLINTIPFMRTSQPQIVRVSVCNYLTISPFFIIIF